MRLVSVTVRNYRVHRELHLDFDARRTLIGGDNETGKSTLIEAIHRALFLRSRGNTAEHRAMRSHFGGSPDVELRFRVGGDEYRLRKCFGERNASTQLVQAGGQSLRGDEAEAWLAKLLGHDEPPGRYAKDQWGHLWVWQGSSVNDPASCAAMQTTFLLKQLQKQGGAVTMQSPFDGRIAEQFAVARDQVLTQAGRPRVGSDLDRAQRDRDAAYTAHQAACQRLSALELAIDAFERAEATIRRTTAELAELERLQQVGDDQRAQVAELRRAEQLLAAAVARAREILDAREAVERDISETRQQLRRVREALQPMVTRSGQCAARREELRRQEETLQCDWDGAQATTRAVRLHRDLAAACVAVHEKRARHEELGARMERVRTLQGAGEHLRKALTALPPIDMDGLAELQDLDQKLRLARAEVEAMAAEIEVVAADRPVRIGEEDVTPGERRLLSETTDVAWGDAVRLRIRPGGGNRLEAARELVRTLQAGLQDRLDARGLHALDQASQVAAERADLQRKLAAAAAALDELDPKTLAAELAAAKEALAAAEAEQNRRRDLVGKSELPASSAEATSWQKRQDAALEEAESAERALQAALQALRERREDLEQERRRLEEDLANDRKVLTGLEANEHLLVKTHGEDDARRQALDVAREDWRSVGERQREIQERLCALRPEALERDRERLQRAHAEAVRQRQEAEKIQAVQQAALSSEGAADPRAEASQARGRLATAEAHLLAVDRKARAIDLLHTLYQQEQHELADRFSQPLAGKVSAYLQCLFGSDARAVVSFTDNAFTGFGLVRSRDEEAMPFDVLSGGTREQVAAAVRLAMAELLAADHDDCLPVVFDDAFAYSDPTRVQELQRMLDLAGTRGLQIIVLAHNPSQYAAFGARTIMLTKSPPAAAPAPLPPPTGPPPAADPGAAPAASGTVPPAAEADCDSFLSALKDMGGRAGNIALRRRLGWSEQRYAAVKDRLAGGGRILLGQGRGGSVRLPDQRRGPPE